MNPYPLSALNHLTVPVAIKNTSSATRERAEEAPCAQPVLAQLVGTPYQGRVRTGAFRPAAARNHGSDVGSRPLRPGRRGPERAAPAQPRRARDRAALVGHVRRLVHRLRPRGVPPAPRLDAPEPSLAAVRYRRARRGRAGGRTPGAAADRAALGAPLPVGR